MTTSDASSISALPIRKLVLADLPRLLELGRDRGWSPEERKWRLLMSVGTAYGIEAPDDDSLLGVYTLTRYGHELAAIGMVLVAKRFARLGVGRRMMRHALEQAAGHAVTLHATDNGRPLYEQLGFTVISAAPMRAGEFRPDPELDVTGIRPAVAADLDAIRRMDADVFGADRTSVIGQMPSFCDQLLVVERSGRLVGYAGSWPNVSNTVVGPVIADDSEIAKQLITALARGAGGALRIDVDVRHDELCRWLDDRGVRARAVPNYVMVHGRSDLPGDIRRRFAPITVAM